jgi:hypothetical protein
MPLMLRPLLGVSSRTLAQAAVSSSGDSRPRGRLASECDACAVPAVERELATQLERRRESARFVVAALNPLHQDRLEHLGYLGVGDDRFATRWFRFSPSVPRYYERFAGSIERMVMQSARLVRIPWQGALLEFLRRAEGSGLDWWLYGSAALAVRGIDVEPGDIDIRVSDADLLGKIFEDVAVTPVEHLEGWVAKRIGRAFYEAVIEWLSEPVRTNDDPADPLEYGSLICGRLETVRWRGHRILVPPLPVQLASCEKRGLTDRALLIRDAMAREATSTRPSGNI